MRKVKQFNEMCLIEKYQLLNLIGLGYYPEYKNLILSNIDNKRENKYTNKTTKYTDKRRTEHIKIKNRLMGIVRTAICGKTSKLLYKVLGCNKKIFRTHMENQFKKGMTWENHGKWHIDHIIPCAMYCLELETHQKECFHYKNLQPLWAEENLKKSSIYNGIRQKKN